VYEQLLENVPMLKTLEVSGWMTAISAHFPKGLLDLEHVVDC